MKPLIGMISFNREQETLATLNSLAATGALTEAEVLVWDNGSTDGTQEALLQAVEFGTLQRDQLWLSPENFGCPKALNAILWARRKPGQHFIKVDNDVELITPHWVRQLCAFLDDHPDVAMASPWYREMGDAPGRVVRTFPGWIEVFPVVGHTVIHQGRFLDETGYFDVLGPDHLYGFEDNLMCHRAGAAGLKCAVVRGVELKNLQRHNSMDVAKKQGAKIEDHKQHVARLRPRYEQRIWQIRAAKGLYHVGPEGEQHEPNH